MIHQFNYPTTILYGPGAVAELATRLRAEPGCASGDRPLLFVTDPGLCKAGVADTVARVFAAAGLTLHRYSGVHGNPIEDDVLGGVAAYREAGAAGIVALGGGSPIDVAKVIAVLATHAGPVERFDDGKGGSAHIDQPMPPIFAIPTTAGTGSEVGRSGVIIARATGVKTVIFHPRLLPRIAVLDPTLTVGLPPHLTAATGLDAFTHGFEAYLSRGFHPIADSIALGCMELCIRHLPTAVARADDLEARGNMQIAAAMGATAFQKGLGFVHSLAHPMSTRYGIHHGLANALLLPIAIGWELTAQAAAVTADLRARLTRVARLLAGDDASAEDLPDAIGGFCRSVGIRDTLPALGLAATDIPALADEAFADQCHRENPIALGRDDLAAVYRRCLGE
jgi:alcohol dehydrogenase class IV